MSSRYLLLGDWVMSPQIHPNGMQDVTDAIHASSRRLIFWFEPERVYATTPLDSEHSEWMLSNPTRPDRYLLNLGNEDALAYISQVLCDAVERLGIDFTVRISI